MNTKSNLLRAMDGPKVSTSGIIKITCKQSSYSKGAYCSKTQKIETSKRNLTIYRKILRTHS
jgi:hypothetical protein